MGQRHFQLRLQGKSLFYQDVGELSLNSHSLKNQLTPNACFTLPSNVDGELVEVHKDRIHAKVLVQLPQSKAEEIQGIDLEPFTPVSENVELQKNFAGSFCPASTSSIYLKTPEYNFSFDVPGHSKPAGFLVNLIIPGGDTRQLLSNVNLDIQGRHQFFIDLNRALFRSDNKELSLQLEVSDYLGSKFVTPTCNFIVDPNLPTLVSINQTTFFQGIYVEVDGRRNLEFAIQSSLPLQEVRLAYHAMDGLTPVKREAYVPFQTNESIWSILTPMPELSGDNRVVIEIESKAGQVARSEFTVDFGVRRYVKGGIRLLSQSSNEKYMVIVNQQDEIIVLDGNFLPKTGPFKGIQGIVAAEVSNDGAHVILLFEDHMRIFNLLTNHEIRIEEPLGSFRILNSANKILAVTGSSMLAWYDLQTGLKERELPVPDETIRFLQLSSREETAIVATDNRNIYKVNLTSSPKAQLIDSCAIGTINVIAIASDSKSFAYNCNEVVFHHRLVNEPKKLEVFRFKSGSGVRSLEFGLSIPGGEESQS
ncbi:hypothetical protein [Oligoflexus tunisiensis]|uniref:hypothetical protein n=1 Tax=Oligoflexus tunisiensis TaxID=708132 RepID=UPI00114D26D4|nr:hypothetical protein [Oligoflexus tunisiensis]